jgi:hypothetical protein
MTGPAITKKQLSPFMMTLKITDKYRYSGVVTKNYQ